MQIRGCKTKRSKVKVENKREDFPRGWNISEILQVYTEPKGQQRGEGEGTGKRVSAALEWHRRESVGQVGLSKCLQPQSGVSIKVGTSNTGIVCESSFVFFVGDRSFHFHTFISPFLSVTLRISDGLYLLCFHVKMSKETKREIIFISHCILRRQWGRYGMGTSSPLSWFSFQTVRTLLASLFGGIIQNQLNWRS